MGTEANVLQPKILMKLCGATISQRTKLRSFMLLDSPRAHGKVGWGRGGAGGGASPGWVTRCLGRGSLGNRGSGGLAGRGRGKVCGARWGEMK